MTAPHETRPEGAPDQVPPTETLGAAPAAGPGTPAAAAPWSSTGLRGRRRRPTGAPPPLPRSLGATGKFWLAVLAVFTGWVLVLLVSSGARRVTDRADAAVLRRIAEVRTGWLTDVAKAFDRVATGWTLTALAVTVLVLLIAFRRWRHLFTFLASILVMEQIGLLLYNAFSRPRPYDVTTIGRWAGFSSPSPPVVVFAAVLVAVIYSLVPAGVARGRAKLVVAGILLAFVVGAPLPGCRPPVRRAGRPGPGHRHPPRRLPPVHAQRGRAGRLPAGQDRAPRRHGPPGRGHPPGGARPAGDHRDRRPAGRARGLGRVHAAAPAGRGRPGARLPVRQGASP